MIDDSQSIVDLNQIKSLDDLEKTAILYWLNRFGGNVTATAQHLRRNRRTLQRKLKDWKIAGDRS